MSAEHAAAVEAARDHLAEHYEVVGEVDLPRDPSRSAESPNETTRLAFVARAWAWGTIGHVVVETTRAESSRHVVGDVTRDPSLVSAPPDLVLDGVTNDELLALHALALDHAERLAEVSEEVRARGGRYYWLADPWSLLFYSTRTEARDARRAARLVRALADGAPVEWVARLHLGEGS